MRIHGILDDAKVIKTGCAFEKRQLESAHALLNALGLFIPWRGGFWHFEPSLEKRRLFLLPRSFRRDSSGILRAREKVTLSPNTTVHEAMLASPLKAVT